jgi:PAS domain S-box-containing protein
MVLYKAELERRVREERKWLLTAIHCINEGIIATDATGAVKVVNPTAERLTGWTQEQALDRDLTEVFRVFESEDSGAVECAVTRLIRQETMSGMTSQRLLLSRNGTRTRIEENAAPIISDSGKMIGVVLAFRSIDSNT